MTTAQPLRPGDPRQLGAWRLTGRLGEGGQGVVYAGQGPDGRLVAVKLLRHGPESDPRARTYFAREVEAAQRVDPFCTARVLDADIEGESPYIVSEYVDGPSLHDVVRAEGPRTGSALDRLAIGTITALAAIHRAGIVHRDFKPANVLLGPDGPRVIDFGIAKLLDSTISITSQVSGTPAYMAPEQLEGAPPTTATDIFAWASTLAYAATGRAPFGNDNIPAVMNRIAHGKPELGGVPESLETLLVACLHKRPERRPDATRILLSLLGYGDLRTVARKAPVPDQLPNVLAEGRNRAMGATPAATPSAPPRTSPALGIAAVALALLFLFGATGTIRLAIGKPNQATRSGPAPTRTVTEAQLVDTDPAVAAARKLIPEVLSHDYRTFDADIAQAHKGMTARFRKEYDRTMDLARLPTKQQKIKVTTNVVESGVISATPGRVHLLVFVDQRSTGAAANTTRVRVTLVRQDSRWLVDELSAV